MELEHGMTVGGQNHVLINNGWIAFSDEDEEATSFSLTSRITRKLLGKAKILEYFQSSSEDQRIKTNGGAAGADHPLIIDFEMYLKDNLYKLWNHLASDSYFPPSV